ncbi:hypothetical protein FA95DRAFT_1605631 [Auriscalpium vulgare]|uniref:Uncharacterized protein n=1 Tax=Auriscalpium vulgare TaxID=40419 RepID=A0ACB8RV83_9AGAM|nr:hypothetical protein FA95DRAFT_1605631 [Auriscalpium vulgare]
MVAALEKMINLSTFKWHAPLIAEPGCPQPWPVLAASCENLRRVEVYDDSHMGVTWDIEDFDLSGLTHFRYFTSYQDPLCPDMTRLGTMLTDRCREF